MADLRKDRIKAKKCVHAHLHSTSTSLCQGPNCMGLIACARRSLGQNFLTDDAILRDIVAAAGVRPGDWVIEVRCCISEQGNSFYVFNDRT